mmetsp:Transcript_25775/g.50423  ORF Transcript_25775/g.50423 Transcript_25775/m.50423 type:complete len:206 (-) Transcript_25775:316-933(-)
MEATLVTPSSVRSDQSWITCQMPRIIMSETRAVSPAWSRFTTPQAQDAGFFFPRPTSDDRTHRNSEPCSAGSIRSSIFDSGDVSIPDTKQGPLIFPSSNPGSGFRIARPVFLIPERFRSKIRSNVISPRGDFGHVEELRLLQRALRRRRIELRMRRINENEEDQLDPDSSKNTLVPQLFIPGLQGSNRRGNERDPLTSTCKCFIM